MKPILFLNDEPETVTLMPDEVTSGSTPSHENEARAGCSCDRWGHPCPGCLKNNRQTNGDASISVTKQSRG
jgi:hypothetical protein